MLSREAEGWQETDRVMQTEKRRVGVIWESTLVSVVSDSDAFDMRDSTTGVTRPSFTIAQSHLLSSLWRAWV